MHSNGATRNNTFTWEKILISPNMSLWWEEIWDYAFQSVFLTNKQITEKEKDCQKYNLFLANS